MSTTERRDRLFRNGRNQALRIPRCSLAGRGAGRRAKLAENSLLPSQVPEARGTCALMAGSHFSVTLKRYPRRVIHQGIKPST